MGGWVGERVGEWVDEWVSEWVKLQKVWYRKEKFREKVQ